MKTHLRRLWLRWLPENKSISGRTFIFLIILILCSMTLLWEGVNEMMQSRLIRCYSQGSNVLQVLRDEEVIDGHSFFFHETSCEHTKDNIRDIRLNARQACAVESAALHHPNNAVFLLLASPISVAINTTNNKAVTALLQYSNIKIRHIDIVSYLENTPLAGLATGRLRRSRWPVSHASDVLRYSSLYKFRGTYMDLDVIVLKPLLSIHNFVGAESIRSLGAGIINFGPDEVGRKMADECAYELQRTFDGSEWGTNGPGVITRVLSRSCNTSKVAEMINANCHGYHVLPVPAFYAFPFWEAAMFFKPGKLAHAQRVLNSSLVIHFWNKVTASYGIPEGDHDVPFLHYAKENCPQVYKAVDARF